MEKHVLLVGNHEALAHIRQLVIQHEDECTGVYVSASADDALAEIRTSHPKLVIAECVESESVSVALLSRLREEDAELPVALVVLSEEAQRFDGLLAADLRCRLIKAPRSFFEKPTGDDLPHTEAA